MARPPLLLAAGLACSVITGTAYSEPAPGTVGSIATSVRAHPQITVRVYDRTRTGERARAAAIKRTRRLLDAAGLVSQFHDCSPGITTSAAACVTPSAGDLIVRMLHAPGDTTPTTRHVLGFATIDAATGRGTMATVFTDRVVALSTLARVPLDTMLSRTIAHEIGHLLLGTSQHSSSGLMREVWTLQEFADGKKEYWSFTATELARLRGPA